VPPPLRRAIAQRLGITDRQLRRRLARGAASNPDELGLSDEQLAYLAVHQSATEAWRALVADGQFTGSLSTFSRRIAAVNQALYEAITEGEEAMRDRFTYPRYQAEAVNDTWQQDTCWSYVSVLFGRTVISPTIELLVDDRSRHIMAVEVWPREPDAELAATTVAAAVSGSFTPNRTPAKPKRIRHDQAAYYTGDHYSRALAAAGILPAPVTGRSPHLKAKVERVIRTMRAELLTALPGSQRVAQALGDGERVRHDARDRLLTFEDFRASVIGWAHWYNTERPHASLDGRVPADVYQSECTEPARIGGHGLRLLTRRPSEKRKTSKNGIRFEGQDYTAPQLVAGIVVDVAPRPGDSDGGLEVYRDDEWWCTAYPSAYWASRMPEFYAERTAVAKRGRTIRKRASELRSRGVPSLVERDEDDHDSLQDELLGGEAGADARWSA
jgi:transposase InsO family protein